MSSLTAAGVVEVVVGLRLPLVTFSHNGPSKNLYNRAQPCGGLEHQMALATETPESSQMVHTGYPCPSLDDRRTTHTQWNEDW